MASNKTLPEFVLFGDSLTEWSFSEDTQGFGLFMEKQYTGKVNILNEGQAGYTSTNLERDFTRIITRATSPTAAKTLLFTIFLGANDACFMGPREYVPWDRFEQNIRTFVDTILAQESMTNTKIVLIGPPPIAIDPSKPKASMSPEETERANELKKGQMGYRTYMSKKRYADEMMRIAEEYKSTGRVVGLNYWRKVVEAGSEEHGGVDEEKPIGCGLFGAKGFSEGYFTDGLHLDAKGYRALSQSLFDLVKSTWPELAPDQL